MVAFTVLLFPPKAALSKFIRMDMERWLLVSEPEYNFHELIQFSPGDFFVFGTKWMLLELEYRS